MRILDILLDRQVVLGLYIEGLLQEFLKHCRKDTGDERCKDKDESDYYRTGGVVFIGNVNYERHSRGIEYANRECAIFNILYCLYRELRKCGALLNVVQEQNALIEPVEKRYGRYQHDEHHGKKHSCISRDAYPCDDDAQREHCEPKEINYRFQEKC